MSTEVGRLGSYRVGDAERARTVDLIKEAHVAGYLTLAEIDERLSSALAARTRADLERLLADLPPEWRARQERQAPVTRGRAIAPTALRALPLVVLAVAMVALIVLAVARGFFLFPWPLLWVWFAFGHRRRGSGWSGRDSHRITWI